MDDPTINILLATFAGLGLPRTLNLQIKASQPIGHLFTLVFDRLPQNVDGLVLTTVSNKQLSAHDQTPVSALLSTTKDRLLSLRLSRRLCGGKGGFGSQLRAAGGRMSSRKNRDRQENVNGSNRNLDGRRLRTVDEAKRLAEYLAIKPEMEKQEKETRKKRWEAIVDAAEKREEDIRSGRSGANQGRLDSQYVESKELAEEKTREAVLRAMRDGGSITEPTGSESSNEDEEMGASDDEESASSSSDEGQAGPSERRQNQGMSLYGWDDDEEDDDDDDDDEERSENQMHGTGSVNQESSNLEAAEPQVIEDGIGFSKGKGKGKACT
ncbi:uncharacterized protein K489DRAFT_409609 [Dissoconium aciculare CBS 342.82]|uniref:Sde2 N-terminal ubiquitin domain-containing protein n=1 Tax=Dissoconium aciculare CBS 342.82 TaxID=1314786 RepID=A0A6J3M7D9_9PEZI|nr:uncharacterized protein K489DRAFT_409609 [Dissoconium aciculare CBS 342.82]KAF1823808.1 hypothetical protein K489DRAFT_409609 [Dissoconium aciculare CBS 342.82]